MTTSTWAACGEGAIWFAPRAAEHDLAHGVGAGDTHHRRAGGVHGDDL